MFLATRKMIRDIDEYAEKALNIKPEALMYNAGRSAASIIKKLVGADTRVLVMCGKGKNGGDGYVIASELFDCDYYVTVFESECESRDASSELYRTRLKKKIKSIHSLSDTQKLSDACANAGVIVDALFGVGFRGNMPRHEADAVTFANASSAMRIAVDIPSGMDSDTGKVSDICFMADHTLTMAYVKRGALIYPAREYCGKIHLCSIGVDRETVEAHFDFRDNTVDTEHIKKYILDRPADSHKGTYGRLMLICGSDLMTGAAVLACEGALRMGVGLVELVCTKRVAEVVSASCPEVIFTVVGQLCEWDNTVYEKILLHSVEADAIVIGCGITQHQNAERLIELLSSIDGCPMLIDADGLNSLDGRVKILEESVRDIVITPHPKEFARLVYCDIEKVLDDKYRAACALCERCGITVLLKGASTVIAAKDGKRYINTTGNSGLSKGGSGDVLSGMIGALLAQGIPSGLAAALGAHIHGAAADMLKKELSEVGMLPRDLPMSAAKYLAQI